MNRDQIVAGGVAGAAFVCSATHIYSVALASGNAWPVAIVHPLGLDGLIYIGMRAVTNGRRWQGWLATVYGVAMSLTFNAVSYAHVAMPAWVMAIAMPLALVLGVLVVGHDKGKAPADPVDTPAPAVVTPIPATVPEPRRAPVPVEAPETVPAITATARKPRTDHTAIVAMVSDLMSADMSRTDAIAKAAAEYGVSTRTVSRALSA